MNLLKHIFVVSALLATMLPCNHSPAHHEHDHGSAVELCAVSTTSCECHSCEKEPCSAKPEVKFNPAPGTQIIESPSNPAVLFILPEPQLAMSKIIPPVSGVLAAIQTVQLLI